MAEKDENKEDLLAQLMIFTTNDTINVAAYLVMSVGKAEHSVTVVMVDILSWDVCQRDDPGGGRPEGPAVGHQVALIR